MEPSCNSCITESYNTRRSRWKTKICDRNYLSWWYSKVWTRINMVSSRGTFEPLLLVWVCRWVFDEGIDVDKIDNLVKNVISAIEETRYQIFLLFIVYLRNYPKYCQRSIIKKSFRCSTKILIYIYPGKPAIKIHNVEKKTL